MKPNHEVNKNTFANYYGNIKSLLERQHMSIIFAGAILSSLLLDTILVSINLF